MVDRAIGFRNWRTSAVLFLLCLAAPACADSEVTNTVRFDIDFGGGVSLTSVNYEITGPNSFRRVGSLTVGAQPTVTATFQNLPTGRGYNILVNGTATDDASTCTGALMFNVTASMTVTLTIPLTCSGLAAITGVINLCPVIDGLSAIPSEANVGGAIDLTAAVRDGDNGPSPLAATWTARGGTLANASTAGATFTCTQPGSFSVGLSISDGDATPRCAATSTVTVVCTEGGI